MIDISPQVLRMMEITTKLIRFMQNEGIEPAEFIAVGVFVMAIAKPKDVSEEEYIKNVIEWLREAIAKVREAGL